MNCKHCRNKIEATQKGEKSSGEKYKNAGGGEEAMNRLGKIKEIKIVPRIGKIISLELLAKQKRAQRGESQTKNRFG
ncbi:hypothetical protein M1N59_01625 [Dehalococcoidales bacterium]|nr:hypothetical protein [Dehalococcoidales bacterium]